MSLWVISEFRYQLSEIEQLVKKRKAMIRVAGDWRSRADLSLILSEGNSETKNYNIVCRVDLKEA